MPNTPDFNTLEEARAEILRLNGEVARLGEEVTNYIDITNEMHAQLENVRELNQQYFLELNAQRKKSEPDDTDDDEPPMSCEDFARTLTI